MAGTLRCAAALALLCAASAALAAGGYGRGRGRGRGGYGGGYGGGNYGGGYGGGVYGGGYGGGGGGYGGGGGGYGGGGGGYGGGGGGGEYPYPPHIPGTNPPGPTTKTPGPPGEPTTPDPNGTTNTGAPGTGDTGATTASGNTDTTTETPTTTDPNPGTGDDALTWCPRPEQQDSLAAIRVHDSAKLDAPPSDGPYREWRPNLAVCSACPGVGDIQTVPGSESLSQDVYAQSVTCVNNAPMCICNENNKCFFFLHSDPESPETPSATALFIPLCQGTDPNKRCNVWVTLDHPENYSPDSGFKSLFGGDFKWLARNMTGPPAEHLTNGIKVRSVACGTCAPIFAGECTNPNTGGRKRRDLGLTGSD